MERGSNPISRHKDDEMKHELQGLLRAAPSPHEEGNDPEPPADDDIRVHAGGPVPPPGAERDRAWATTEADSLRLELARHMDRTAFPADRRRVLGTLEAHHAPDSVIDEVRALPPEGRYANVTEVVEGLGHHPTR
ncbi:DUF2795 domain-containing protein [Streptomyces sp. NPDC026672]|uniref:DUF2795 domain-containing protein n=1 Tax=unclassified Streptomyces TaxID=2593676 RepID=UPI0033DD65D9